MQVGNHIIYCHTGILHIEATKADGGSISTSLIMSTHPQDHIQHFLGVPGPEMQTGQQLSWISFPGVHILVDQIRLGPACFDGKNIEIHLLDQKLQESVLHQEKLVCPMCGLAQSDNAGVPYKLFDGQQIIKTAARQEGGEEDGMILQSGDYLLTQMVSPFLHNKNHPLSRVFCVQKFYTINLVVRQRSIISLD